MRIARLSLVGALVAILIGAVACGGGATTPPNPTGTRPTPTPIGMLPATVHPGDPTVYADALARFQKYLDLWWEGQTTEKNAMLEPETQPDSVPNPQLLG